MCNHHHRITYTIVGWSQVWKILGNCFANFMTNCFDFLSVCLLLYSSLDGLLSSFKFSDHSSTLTFIEHGYLKRRAFSIPTLSIVTSSSSFLSLSYHAKSFLDRICNWSIWMYTKVFNCGNQHLLCLCENTNVSGNTLQAQFDTLINSCYYLLLLQLTCNTFASYDQNNQFLKINSIPQVKFLYKYPLSFMLHSWCRQKSLV